MKITLQTKDVDKVLLIKSTEQMVLQRVKNKLVISNLMTEDPFMFVSLKDVLFDDTEKPFAVIVEAATFNTAIKNLKGGEIIILDITDSGRISITGDKSKTKYKVASSPLGYENPSFKDVDYSIKVKADEIFGAIDSIKMSCAESTDTRISLTGINLLIKDSSNIEMASTDGRRLALNTISHTSDAALIGKSVIVNPDYMGICKKVWNADPTPDVSFDIVRNSSIVFKVNDFVVAKQLVEGAFPDYAPIFDGVKDSDKSFSFNMEAMEKLLNDLNIKAHEGRNDFDVGSKSIGVSVKTNDFESDGEIDVLSTSGIDKGGIKFAINYNFLLDFIRANKSIAKEFTVKLQDQIKKRPILVELEKIRYIVMPLS